MFARSKGGVSPTAQVPRFSPERTTVMRIAKLSLALVVFLLPACDLLEFEGDPANGAFPASSFTLDEDETRSDLVSVESACEAYCGVASSCGDIDSEACVDGCVEPKLATNTETATSSTDCATQYASTMSCAQDSVCDELAACDQAVDEYVSCTLTVAP